MERITIIGLGLIGGSLGLALKALQLSEVEIVGYDVSNRSAKKAKNKGALDRSESNIVSAVKDSDFIIIATPVMAIKDVLETISPHLLPDSIVTDTGSTKAQVMEWADNYLPDYVSFVGGHPMAGKEVQGIDNADGNLFLDCTYCIVPSVRAKEKAVKSVVGMAELVGAKPFFLDASEHDGLVAGVSHLPLILSTALVSATDRSTAWREMAKLASTGYRDVSRLASGDPEISGDICLSNRESILRWIDKFIDELDHYKTLIKSDTDELRRVFAEAVVTREKWLKGIDLELEGISSPELPSMGESMTNLFVGGAIARRTKKFLKAHEEKSPFPKKDEPRSGNHGEKT